MDHLPIRFSLCPDPPLTSTPRGNRTMASEVLCLHSLFRLPAAAAAAAPSSQLPKLAFSLSSSCSSFATSRLSLSGAVHSKPLVSRRMRSTVVRAEAEDEGAITATVQEDVSESEQETEVEEEKPPRKPIVKLGDIMGILNKRAVEASEKERPVPDIRTGDIVEIRLEVPENRRRLSVYKGIVMSRQNAGIHTTIRIRRIIAGIGVEIVFPIYSPNIKEIKVVSHRKVRRARLYYLREKLPRLSTFK